MEGLRRNLGRGRIQERGAAPYSTEVGSAAREPCKMIRLKISSITCFLPCSVRSRCSHTLIVLIPFAFSSRATPRARFLFPSIFDRQYLRFALGSRRHRGHPCQKQPSTKTATRRFGNQKSGCPVTRRGCICQPLIPRLTRASLNRLSVERLPIDRTFDLRKLRSSLLRTSMYACDKNL